MTHSLCRNPPLLACSLLALLTWAGAGCSNKLQENSNAASASAKQLAVASEAARHSKHVTVGVLLPPQDDPSTQALLQTMQNTAAANNMTLTVQYLTDSFASPSMPPIQPLLNAKPDAVILFSHGGGSIDTNVQAANTAHIPAFTVEERTQTGQVVAHIRSNVEQGGKLAGQRLAALLHDTGGVLVLAGDFVPKATKAFREELARHPGITILAETPFQSKSGKSEADVRAAFAKFNGKINGVFALSDTEGDQAVQECETQERHDVVIVGFLGGFTAEDALKKGNDSPWRAEISSSTAGLSKTSVERVAAYLRGEKVPPLTEVDMEAIDASDVETWAYPTWSTNFE